MASFNFKKGNLIAGWLVFAVALLTYWLTVEPTTSFWDASEYITTSSNLEVGHPPGAPLYQILGAFFSIFAFGNVAKIALMVNLVSVFSSAFTILFMFWSMTLLLQQMLSANRETVDTPKALAILGSAVVGSLAFTFSDSFWFSAVEAEVYAMASLMIAVLFYLGLLWQRDMHRPRGNRWLILIALIVGLSFGVHFMALLTIPSIGLLYYFKNTQKITVKNFIIGNVVVVGILLFIFMFLLPMSMRFFSSLELFFVNNIGLPFHSGTIIAGLLMVAAFYFLLRYTRQKELPLAHMSVLSILFVFIGFSSWIMLPVRSNAGTTINQNHPGDAQELLSYYNREQYGGPSLLYSGLFSEAYVGLDKDNPYRDAKPNYERDDEAGKYVIVNKYKDALQNLEDSQKAFLPRMWSTDEQHRLNYMSMYAGPLDFEMKRRDLDRETLRRMGMSEEILWEEIRAFRRAYAEGKVDMKEYDRFLQRYGQFLDIEKPGFWDNMRYMFDFQFGKMYFRYFMWNFAGRQNDIQYKGDVFNGNWISGINFIDSMRLGPQDKLPGDMKNNKGRNTYFFLPLILGLLGLLLHAGKDWKSFWVLMVLFLFTGLALKVYLNERPFEPRERDYALVGSFYVFAMWIGFGAYALFESIRSFLKPKWAAPVAVGLSLLAAPVLMAAQNWDDHNRSNKYTAQAMGRAYLDSLDENAIIFTIGDNDTFALWYAQSVEGHRTDVRVINTMLFMADWYISDMKKKAYESDPIPSQLTRKQFRGSTRDALYHARITQDTISIKQWMSWVADETGRTLVELMNGDEMHSFPSKNIRIPVDKEAVLRSGIVAEKDAHLIVPHIDIRIGGGEVLYKNRLMMLDILANNNWERPIYFSGGSFNDEEYLWMKDYLQQDGMAYKLVPIRTEFDRRNPLEMGRIDTEKSYEIVMNWDWGNSGDPNIYHDPETRRNSISYRGFIARLAGQLIEEGDKEKAEEVLDLAMQHLPVEPYGYYTLLEAFVANYLKLENKEKGVALFDELAIKYQDKLNYFADLPYGMQDRYFEDIFLEVERYRALVDVLFYSQDETIVKPRAEDFNRQLDLFKHFYGESDADEDDLDMSDEELMQLLQDIKKMETEMDIEAVEDSTHGDTLL